MGVNGGTVTSSIFHPNINVPFLVRRSKSPPMGK